MEFRFDLHETQMNILEKCPEWQDLMNVVEFKNTPWAEPTGYGEKTVYYNSRGMRQFPQDAQAYLIAQQLMHIQLAHEQRGKGRDRKIWDLACAAVVNELLLADGFEPPVNIFRQKDAGTLSAEEMYDFLSKQVYPEYKVGLVHGKVSEDEQTQIRSLILYGQVTGKATAAAVTGNSMVYNFLDEAGNTLASVELYNGLLVRPDGMYFLN